MPCVGYSVCKIKVDLAVASKLKQQKSSLQNVFGSHILEIIFCGEPKSLQPDNSLKNRLCFGGTFAAVKSIFLNIREYELRVEKQ